MKIAIIGAGKVGQALGGGFIKAGHEVIYGVRSPEAESSDELESTGATVVSLKEAAQLGEVIVVTTPWNVVQDVVTRLGDLHNKILIDVTNPIGPDMTLTHGHTDSGAEQVARWVPTARVAKAFNTNGVEVMRDTTFPEGKPWMPVCADDPEALSTAMQLASDLGYDVLAFPELKTARLLEPLTLLWIKAAGQLGSREIALRLMQRE